MNTSNKFDKNICIKKEEMKCHNIMKKYKIGWLLCCYKRKHKEHNPKWQQIPDHPYRLLIIRGSGYGKTNSSFHPISHQPDIIKYPSC